jgi:GNAT superfamily N-acetyltransferase
MVKIRKATMNDLEAIRKLNQDLFVLENETLDKTIDVASSFSADHKKRFIDNIKNDFVVVAIEDKAVVGYLVGKISEAESYRNVGKIVELDSFLVNEKFRSKKIGHRLVAELKKWAKTRGILRLRTTASAGNIKAIKFYNREGFEDYDLTLEQELR